MYNVTMPKKNDRVIHIKVDPFKLPSQELLQARLRNKAQVFEDRRFKKPKHKKDYTED
jgi:hypothetical protein